MTPGSAIVVGTTLLVAVLDGGLSLLLTAAAIGGGAYVTTRRSLNALPDKILKTQVQIMDAAIHEELRKQAASPKGIDDTKVKAMQRDAKAKVEQLEAACREQQWGNREMAALVGLACFASPALGVITLAGNLAAKAGVFDNDQPIPRVDWAEAISKAAAVPA